MFPGAGSAECANSPILPMSNYYICVSCRTSGDGFATRPQHGKEDLHAGDSIPKQVGMAGLQDCRAKSVAAEHVADLTFVSDGLRIGHISKRGSRKDRYPSSFGLLIDG